MRPKALDMQQRALTLNSAQGSQQVMPLDPNRQYLSIFNRGPGVLLIGVGVQADLTGLQIVPFAEREWTVGNCPDGMIYLACASGSCGVTILTG